VTSFARQAVDEFPFGAATDGAVGFAGVASSGGRGGGSGASSAIALTEAARASVASGSVDRRKVATEGAVIKTPHSNLAIRLKAEAYG
jgi:hypothetical protein